MVVGSPTGAVADAGPDRHIERVPDFVPSPALVGTGAYFRSTGVLTPEGWVSVSIL